MYGSATTSRALPATFCGDQPGEGVVAGTSVFVRLKPGEGGIWRPVVASLGEPAEPAVGPDEVDIRGKLEFPWSGGSSDDPLPVEYGIERFYMPEGAANDIQSDLRERTFIMKVAVSADGTAQIKAFLDGDKLVYREPLY